MEGILQKLRDLDAYPKINEDFYKRTFSGGVITIVSGFIMFLLFFFELKSYFHTVTETTLVVDASRGGNLRINFDITFPNVPCTVLTLDAEDISGEKHFDIKHDIVKKRIDAHGNIVEARKDGIGAQKIERPLQKHGGRLEHNETYCGSCFGAEMADHECCNSCEEVREAYRKKGWALTNVDLIDQCEREGFFQKIDEEKGEGCTIIGFLEVNKVAGTFHFVPGKTFHLSDLFSNDLIAVQKDNYNISHRINKLSFGEYFPGVVNPLDGKQRVQVTTGGLYQYFVKVVPTEYTDVKKRTIHSNQFSLTEHYSKSDWELRTLPGVFFFYDLSPVKVIFMEKGMSFLHFLTNVCAIVGGAFTVAGLADSFFHNGRRVLKRKLQSKKSG